MYQADLGLAVWSKAVQRVMLRSRIRRDQRCVERLVGLERQKKLQTAIDVRVATSRLYSVEGKTKFVQSAFGMTTGKMIQMPT